MHQHWISSFDIVNKYHIMNIRDLVEIKALSCNVTIPSSKVSLATLSSLYLSIGFKPVPVHFKISESAFSIRKGNMAGFTISIKDVHAVYSLLDYIVTFILPLCNSPIKVNSTGNISIGIENSTILPELAHISLFNKNIFGFDLTIGTTKSFKGMSRFFFSSLEFPII